jgi:hypothetical protein
MIKIRDYKKKPIYYFRFPANHWFLPTNSLSGFDLYSIQIRLTSAIDIWQIYIPIFRIKQTDKYNRELSKHDLQTQFNDKATKTTINS